jgi:hypothetical protein
LVHFAILLQRIDRHVACLRGEALCGTCSAKAENTLWEMDEKTVLSSQATRDLEKELNNKKTPIHWANLKF